MHDRVTAFGRQLVEIHERLRDGFGELRAELAAGGVPGRSLPEHCAAFCAAVERHHTAEDREERKLASALNTLTAGPRE